MPTVLLAISERELRDSCSRFLSRHGYQFRIADDGLACMAQLRQCVPDMLVLDLELPWGGGDGVLGVLRDELRTFPRDVVLTSTAFARLNLDELMSTPNVRILRKPFPLSDLLRYADADVPFSRIPAGVCSELYIG